MKLVVVENIANKKLRKKFKKLADKSSRKEVMRAAAAALRESTEYAFEQERDPSTNEKWADWTDDYRDWREEHGHTPGKILTLSGQLATSMTTEYDDSYAVIGSNKVYAAIHQWGGLPDMAPGPAAIPARPYMGLDDVSEGSIYDAIEKQLNQALED